MGKEGIQKIKPVLEKIVGPRNVSDAPAVCQAYAFNPFMGTHFSAKPDMVVMPQSAEQVSAILKAANQYQVPVTPKGAIGLTGTGGPIYGGVLLDLVQMDKIISIDAKNMKAVGEAGCSFYKLAQALFKQDLILPTPTWYTGASLAGSALLPSNGIGKTRYGPDIDLVEGFEVVLPNGDIINVGSMAYAKTDFGPFYRYIYGPDLVGLFAKSNGVFGIVTKVAHFCLRKPKYWGFHTYYWPRQGAEDLTRAMIESTAMEVFDAHLNDKWRWLREGNPVGPEDAYFTLTFAVTAENETELKGKEQAVHECCRSCQGTYLPDFAQYFHLSWPTAFLAGYPRRPLPVRNRGEGFNLDEFIYPTSAFPEVYGKIEEILKKYGVWEGFPPIKPIYDGYPMKRLIIASQTWVRIKDHDPGQYQQFLTARDELRDWYIHKGGMYQQRMPPLLPDFTYDVQRGAIDLARTIKKALDPNNILSPSIYDGRSEQ